jgi:hypothetical protein
MNKAPAETIREVFSGVADQIKIKLDDLVPVLIQAKVFTQKDAAEIFNTRN